MTATERARPLPSTVAHLDAIVATGGEGWLVLSAVKPRPPGSTEKKAKWLSASFTPEQVDEAAEWATERDTAGLNVYVRSNLMVRPLRYSGERGGAEHTGAAVALVVDLDVAGPGHKPGAAKLPLPPNMDTAMAIVAELPPPSMNIHTGGGAHLWWLLDEPEHDKPVALIEDWADRIVYAGARRGWHVDRPDAARVLRVCGTHRRKLNVTPNMVTLKGEAAVTGWPADGTLRRPWCPTGRYGARDLLEALEPPPAPVAPLPPVRPRHPGEIGPADAVATLPWSIILEPLGWTYVGAGRMDGKEVELWKRPGDPTSDYSVKAIPDGPCVAWSDACGLPTGRGQKLSKWRVFVALHHGGDKAEAGRIVRSLARSAVRHG
jgi:hypothetical protein